MLYTIDGAQAEDDGSAWKYRPSGSGFSRFRCDRCCLPYFKTVCERCR